MQATISLLLLAFFGIALSKDCLQCICELESFGCRPIGCNWDAGSLSCGYYQIKLPYYQDCGAPWRNNGESIENAWKRCANIKECATQCVRNYVGRYGGQCPGRSDCEQMARIHNGGPNGCNSGTDWYWGKIQQCICLKTFSFTFRLIV